MKYNGWTNWRTWNLYNWICSAEEFYNKCRQMTEEELKEYCETPGSLPALYYEDEKDAPAGEVNFSEIFRALHE